MISEPPITAGQLVLYWTGKTPHVAEATNVVGALVKVDGRWLPRSSVQAVE